MSLDALALAVLWLGLTWARAELIYWVPATAQVLEEVSVALHGWMIFIFAPVWAWSLSRNQAYTHLQQPPRLAVLTRASGLAMLISLGVFFATHVTDFLSRSLVFAFAAAAVPTLWASRAALAGAIRRGWLAEEPLNVLFIGDADDAESLARRTGAHALGRLALGPGPAGDLPLLGNVTDIGVVLAQHPVDQVLLTRRDLPQAVLRTIAARCEEVGVPFSMEAGFVDRSLARATLERVDDAELLTFTALPHDPSALAVKRAMDVVVASVMLALLAPVMAAVALAIRAEDGGPVLFKQQRVGRFGRRFTMLKFRSMHTDAERHLHALAEQNEADGPVFKMARDPRITIAGRWLRRSSLDELPQLVNVLRGEMSLVGPRPPLPDEVDSYEAWQRRRLSMKPGLTCIWQVSGRSRLDFETWMRLDLHYIDNWSLGLDLLLLLRTVPAVLSGDGAR